MCRAVCTLRKDLRRPQLSSLADPEALHRKEVKAKAQLPTAQQSTEGMSQHAHSSPLQDLDFLLQGIYKNLGPIISQSLN